MSGRGPSRLRAFAARLRRVLRGPRQDERFDDEVQEHLRLLEDRFVGQGMSRGEAALTARRQFGNTTLLQEDRRALETLPSIERVWQDLRYALRTVGRNPAFAAVAITTLGLGIGAATAIYSVIHNVMLAPFPYRDADRLVFPRIYDLQQGPEIGRQGYSASEVMAFVEGSDLFDATTAALGENVRYRHQGGTESLSGAHVTPGTFTFFGMPALHGRVLQPADHEPGAPPVFVLRYKTWMERFGGDVGILDKTFVLNGTPRTLVGIMPSRFGWYGSDLFLPAAALAGRQAPTREYWFLVGRLKPDVTVEQARAQLTVIAQRLAKTSPDLYPERFGVYVGTLIESVVGPIRATLYTVLAAVGLLLVIACGNVANLLLARATTREREFALRTALGAGRTRIIRLLLVESLILATGGAAMGILLAWGGLKALVAVLPPRVVPSEAVIALNAPVLAVTLAIAVLTALVCGLAPALHSSRRRDLSDPLRDSAKGTSGGSRGRRLRDALVALEVALSLTLLIGAGLLMRSFVALRDVRLGLQPDHVFTAVLQLPADRYVTTEQVTAFLRPLLARIKALPGVAYASASTAGALDGGADTGMEIAGKPPGASRTMFRQVTEDYFEALRLEFRAGRPFSEADVTDARRVAVVNETFVRTYLAGDAPLGQRVRLASLERGAAPVRDAWFEIVGVVGDVRNRGLRASVEPDVWIPSTVARSVVHMLNVRTSQDPATLTSAVRREVSATDAAVPLIGPGRLADLADRGLYAAPKFGFLVMLVFASIGLILVTVGVYSVLTYSTAQRTREIGIRMALGARYADVLGTVVSGGLQPIVVGIAMGLTGSVLLGRAISTQLVGVTPYDLRTLAASAALLGTIAAIACWIPARRAARVDPLIALRRE